MTATDEASSEQEQALETMYLSSFKIAGFRSCADVTVELQPTLTLLVGENNAGKSNVIDALRLCTSPLSGRRTRYFETDDVNRHQQGSITLSAEFDGLTKFQRAQYIGALNVETGLATYTTRYSLPDDAHRRGRVEQLAGATLDPDSEPEKRDQINHVYLEPLRNAQRELDSASGTRLTLIMQHLVSAEDRQEFVEHAQDNLKKLSEHAVVTTTSQNIQTHLSGLTAAVRQQNIGMGFEVPELSRLAKSLRLKMAEHGIDPSDLSASGLGYANLLYLATVVLELQKAKTSELTLFLVEEPEAHLHPQLQAVLLEYLQEQAEQSVAEDSEGPAGRIQIVATTHSPNLASAVGTKNVVVLRSVTRTMEAVDDSPASAVQETAAIALSRLGLSSDDRRKIDQYLDVTRSELLFTQRAVFVEGVAEAVVIPALARHCVLAGAEDDARRDRRAFRGTSIISVGSVDFAPYIRLLLTKVAGVRLADSVVVITDGDPALPSVKEALSEAGEGAADADELAPAYNRAKDLQALGIELDAGSALYVAEAPHTLEADLLVEGSANESTLKTAYLAQHPRSSAKWDAIAGSEDPSQALYEALRGDKKLIAKGQFAHDVATQISDGAEFTCPEYLSAAIRRIVDGPTA